VQGENAGLPFLPDGPEEPARSLGTRAI
jgi:hypothetical protein